MMRRLVVFCGVVLGALATCIGFLQAIQEESVLPLNTSDVGFINFQLSDIPPAAVDEQLQEVSSRQWVEIFQLSGTTGIKTVKIIARGFPQPTQLSSITWVNPSKTGVLLPSANATDIPPSGVYALKGTKENIAGFKQWLTSHGAVHTWEQYSSLELLLLPLAYQGVIAVVLVTALLTSIIIIGWFISKRRSQVVRMLNGYSNRQIVMRDLWDLIFPLFSTCALSSICTAIVISFFSGRILPVLVTAGIILIVIAALIAVFSLIVAVLSRVKISEFAQRKPLPLSFSIVSFLLRMAVLLLVFTTIPLTFYAAQVAQSNYVAAQKASEYSDLYTANFGGIVDENRDWNAHVEDFAKLVTQLENEHKIFYAKLYPEESNAISGIGVDSVVVYNEDAFNLFYADQTADLREVPASSLSAQTLSSLGLSAGDLRVFLPEESQAVIGVRGTGLFQVAENPVIIVLPQVSKVHNGDLLMSHATTGAVIFTDSDNLLKSTSQIGLNLTFDNIRDKNAVYASDQRLAYQVSLFTLGTLIVSFLASIFISALIYANRRRRALFPRYLNGASWTILFRVPLVTDFLGLVLALTLSLVIAYALSVNQPAFLIATVIVFALISFFIYRRTIRKAMLSLAIRKVD
ncbi:hypothetical protein [Schaalia sp. lx-260]|uniref:hypothetical protein n=1 Tax=Schaalia sp. lx-260 TaxID=2899082 RepID=UPI001E2D06EF|nr:hypothetical protein [Schaalia sp. lx-260]MCD4549513.1 hypothetical protein [Schaalia sp. lx-260]